MSITDGMFTEYLKEWLELDNTEQEAKKSLSLLRKRKVELRDSIEKYMLQKGQKIIDTDNAMIEIVTKKTTSSNKKGIIDSLVKNTNISKEKATGLLNLIHNNRPTVEKTTLKITNNSEYDSLSASEIKELSIV